MLEKDYALSIRTSRPAPSFGSTSFSGRQAFGPTSHQTMNHVFTWYRDYAPSIRPSRPAPSFGPTRFIGPLAFGPPHTSRQTMIIEYVLGLQQTASRHQNRCQVINKWHRDMHKSHKDPGLLFVGEMLWERILSWKENLCFGRLYLRLDFSPIFEER